MAAVARGAHDHIGIEASGVSAGGLLKEVKECFAAVPHDKRGYSLAVSFQPVGVSAVKTGRFKPLRLSTVMGGPMACVSTATTVGAVHTGALGAPRGLTQYKLNCVRRRGIHVQVGNRDVPVWPHLDVRIHSAAYGI